jgi:hypothetical protein
MRDMLEKRNIFLKFLRAGRRTYFFDLEQQKQMITILRLLRVKFYWRRRIFYFKNIKYIYTKICLSQKSWRMTSIFSLQRKERSISRDIKRFQKNMLLKKDYTEGYTVSVYCWFWWYLIHELILLIIKVLKTLRLPFFIKSQHLRLWTIKNTYTMPEILTKYTRQNTRRTIMRQQGSAGQLAFE